MTVTTKKQAWKEANKLFPTDYEKDEIASHNAGYDIYRHSTLNHYSRICDLGCRLEVLTGEYGEVVTNIWIVEEPKASAFTATITYTSGDAVMTKTMNNVEKVERAWEVIGNEKTEVVRVYDNGFHWATWIASGVIKIEIVAE